MSKVAEFLNKVAADEAAKAEFDAVIGVRKERELNDGDFQKIVELSKKLGASVTLDEVKDFFSGNGWEVLKMENMEEMSMKKKILALLLAVTFVISCSACAGKEGGRSDGNVQKETGAVGGETTLDTKAEETDKAQTEETDQAETGGGEYEYPSEDAGTVEWESPHGYSMTYDPTVFTLDDTGEADVFTYNTAEKLDAPVYISVQAYPDMDAETLADGLVLQSGIDGVEAQDAYFGADSMETKNVYIEKEVDGVKQIQIFYAIPAGEGSLLVEMGSYVGVPENVDWKFEEMLGTFALK